MPDQILVIQDLYANLGLGWTTHKVLYVTIYYNIQVVVIHAHPNIVSSFSPKVVVCLVTY
jgi:hypothetical protein